MRSSLAQKDSARLNYPYSSRKGPEAEKLNLWRWKMSLLLSLLFLLSVFYFFLYSPLFTLMHITVSETHFIPQAEVESYIHSFRGRRRALIFKQSNYFTLDKTLLKEELIKEFKLKNILISRTK